MPELLHPWCNAHRLGPAVAPATSVWPHRYDFGTVHAVAKGFGIPVDTFMYGFGPLGLLLWWGDVAGMRAGLAKVLDAHTQVATRVRRGDATPET